MIREDVQFLLDAVLTEEAECTDEFRTCLRMFLEWTVIGRPQSRYIEYSSLLAMLPPCAEYVDRIRLQNYSMDEADLQPVIDQLLAHLSSRGVQYRWIPYLLKGLSGFEKIEAAMIAFVEEEWRKDEKLVSQAIMIHFNHPLIDQQISLLDTMIKNARCETLVSEAKRILRFHLDSKNKMDR